MQDMAAPTVDYYEVKTYWNAFPAVIDYQNRASTGNANLFWYQQLARSPDAPYQRALMLNCGNGWVERALLENGLIKSAVGVDISSLHLDEARRLAAESSLPLDYVQMDINHDDLPPGPFDLIVNYAAAHHIAFIDRVFRQLCSILSPTGKFVSWDYIGPHRNQYTSAQWSAAWDVNKTLPSNLQQRMTYPSVAAMIEGDPTEAVHSELIVPTMERYFSIETFRPLGGAIGYLVLTHNDAFYSVPYSDVASHVERIVAEDERYVHEHPKDTLFAYIVASPKKEALKSPDLAAWTLSELNREANCDGAYYPSTMLGELYWGGDDADANAGIERRILSTVPRQQLIRHLLARSVLGSLYRAAKYKLRRQATSS